MEAYGEARLFAEKAANLLGRVLVVMHGSFVHGGFHSGSDIDLIVVSPVFEGVRPIERPRLLWSIAPVRAEIICWTPRELEAQLRDPFWRGAFCRGYVVLVDTLGLRGRIREVTGCAERRPCESLF